MVLHEVAGQLQDRELIERQVAIEGAHHPLPVGPHFAKVVDVDAVRVGVSRVVEPVAAAVFAPLEACEPRIDEPFVRVGGGVGDEGINHRGVGGQSGEVKRDPSGNRPAIGFRGRSEALRFEAGEDETVDRVFDPGLVFYHRRLGTCRRDERPVRLVLRSLGDPPLEEFLLLGRERFLEGRRRHDLLRIVREDAVEHDTRIGITRNDCPRLNRLVAAIEP